MRPHKRSLARYDGAWALACAAACIWAIAGCSAGTVSKEDFEEEWGSGIGTEDLFGGADAPDFIGKLAEKVGRRPIRATKLIVYPSYAILEAQDPKRPDNLDEYTYRDGSVGDPRPVRITSPFEGELFTLDAATVDKLPAILEEGRKRVALGGAHPTHVTIRKHDHGPEPGTVQVCAYFDSGRGSGGACFDVKGAFRRAF